MYLKRITITLSGKLFPHLVTAFAVYRIFKTCFKKECLSSLTNISLSLLFPNPSEATLHSLFHWL